jgi:hypothetical protein
VSTGTHLTGLRRGLHMGVVAIHTHAHAHTAMMTIRLK